MKKTILTLMLGIILLTALVSAEVYEDNYVRYGTITPDGILTPTNTPLNNANFIGFVCSSYRCANVSSRLWPGVLTTNNDYKQLVYPTILQSQYGYAVIVYKDGYIPFGINPTWAGNGVAPGGPFYDYLTKKEICGPKFTDYTITNNCRTINAVTVVRAPISKAGVIDYYPQEIASQFTSNVDVIFEVRKDNVLVYTETKRVSLFFSEEKDVSFSYPATSAGTYDVKIISTTDDSRCLTKAIDTKEQQLSLPVCCSNLDCGTNGFTGNPFCQSNNVFQNFITYTCNNPGQANSYCSDSICSQSKQDCGADYCDSFGNNYCRDNKIYRSRTCYDKGCATGACFSIPSTEEELVQTCNYGCSNNQCNPPAIICNNNSDCGTNGFTGNPFCQSNNVFQNFITYTCNNPGTANSYCSNSTCSKFKQDCGTNICLDGSCHPVCTQNSDCGNETSRLICETKNVIRETTTPKCLTNSCTSEITKITVEICDYKCKDGKCVDKPHTNPCNIPGNPNCEIIEEPPIIEEQEDISYTFIEDTIHKLDAKEIKCKYYFCNTTWLWLLIALLLLLLIILILSFILWVLGAGKHKKNK